MNMIRFIRQLFGCSRRQKIVNQSLAEHRYVSKRNIDELQLKTNAVEMLVMGLQRNISK